MPLTQEKDEVVLYMYITGNRYETLWKAHVSCLKVHRVPRPYAVFSICITVIHT